MGITGAPGAGKSTLTDQLIDQARERGLDGSDRVAVLAIDPSSPFSGGAILGDRVRMQSHALDDKRLHPLHGDPRPPGRSGRGRARRRAGPLGGRACRWCCVETVGVGQQEVAVAAATDTTVVVVNPGWGDAIQANKAGLLEIADLFVINKADRPGARETRRDLELMLDLTQLGDWRPPIVETVATEGKGVDELWTAIGEHRAHLIERWRPRGLPPPAAGPRVPPDPAGPGRSSSSMPCWPRTASPGWWPTCRRVSSTPTRRPTGCWTACCPTPERPSPGVNADRVCDAARASDVPGLSGAVG